MGKMTTEMLDEIDDYLLLALKVGLQQQVTIEEFRKATDVLLACWDNKPFIGDGRLGRAVEGLRKARSLPY